LKKIVLNLLKQKYNLVEADIEIYLFGSRVYGTFSERSDSDYIVITDKDINNQEIKHDLVNIHIYNRQHFQKMLFEHKIIALEIFFLYNTSFDFDLDKSLLRKEISGKASNSFVKCKKKLLVENDYYIGLKSLFHSLRIIDFGIQIADKGRIYDFSSCNDIWNDLNSRFWTWNELNEIYKPVFNSKMTEFRKVCPK
jgi:predicted nucleotidyltransferase